MRIAAINRQVALLHVADRQLLCLLVVVEEPAMSSWNLAWFV